ncbi:MAG: hypothetical protein A3E83_05635 [Gammaproteobacteria bacterium RIFCSPHIGHO2_12_FULL_41_20]|nr:MAG: hypothetical protein A3E83_05635 [Gammaproteobacteria bacterium RIFCSPHIGHO2_12_FULL_41_20]
MTASRETKTPLTDLLPTELWQQVIGPYLRPQEVGHLSRTCREAVGLFQPQIDIIHAHVQKLLTLVTTGQQDQAETLLLELQKEDPYLLQQVLSYKGKVTDCSGRAFHGITALQYALWAYDRHMWEMLLKYIPSTEAHRQLQELETTGTEHGKHYDFQPLLDAYQAHITHIKNVFKRTGDLRAAKKSWAAVGKQQGQVPACVANQYCRRDKAFIVNGQVCAFNDTELPRTLLVYDIIKGQAIPWFPLPDANATDGLGISFAICKRAESRARIASNVMDPVAQDDLAAMTALRDARQLDLEQLCIKLEYTRPLSKP